MYHLVKVAEGVLATSSIWLTTVHALDSDRPVISPSDLLTSFLLI